MRLLQAKCFCIKTGRPTAHADVTSLSFSLTGVHVHAHILLHAHTHTHTHTQTLSQHILSQSASHSRAERAPGSEAVNLAHVDMYLWMAYTQQSCWADQSQITFANNSQCLFFPNGEPGGRVDRISLEVNCQTPEKYFDCICKSLPVFPPKTHIVLSCKLTSPT